MKQTTSSKQFALLYNEGRPGNFVAAVSLTPVSFVMLLSEFSKFSKFKWCPGQRFLHVVLCCVLYYYTAAVELKTLCEKFGIPLSTLSNTLANAEIAFEFAQNDLQVAAIRYPTKETQLESAAAVPVRESSVTGIWGFVDGKTTEFKSLPISTCKTHTTTPHAGFSRPPGDRYSRGFTTNSAPPPQLDNSSSASSDTDEFTRDLPTCTTTDEEESMGMVIVNGCVWAPSEGVNLDQAAHMQSYQTAFRWPALLELGERTFVKYFYLMYPMSSVPSTIENRNNNLRVPNYRTISEGEQFRWIGIRLAMAMEPRRGSLKCMSTWKGKEKKYAEEGLPHKTKIIRKTEGVGTELKAIADDDSGVLLGLELVEGTERQKQKPYAAELGEGTAIVLRLAEPYKGTGRTIVADSAFAYVKTLVKLESLFGLYFLGMVKTETKEYPIEHMKKWFSRSPSRGSWEMLRSSTDTGAAMYAMFWEDQKPKTIISNRGTTLPGTDSVRIRHHVDTSNGFVWTIRVEKRISRPQMMELIFSM
ncbi:unnamed protein product [Phytophthora fragariaefolia]|uniref:Unnamed protein product n=1 Tax=Phytophthora fragariaefolia TaxID=1490495 RepID=A0A9W7CLC6_9STRA|nr:unnamed protein product [Phytophthora fragariaefolia]